MTRPLLVQTFHCKRGRGASQVCVKCDLVSFVSPFSRVMPHKDGALSRCQKAGSRCSLDQSRVQSNGPRSTAQSEQHFVSRMRDPLEVRVSVRSFPQSEFSRNPDDVADARSRVGKLESAISVLDENHPTMPALKASEITNSGPPCGRADRKHQALSSSRERKSVLQWSGRRCKGADRVAGGRGEGSFGGRFSVRGGKPVGSIAIGSPARKRESHHPLHAELLACMVERDELRLELDSRVGEGQEIRQRKTRSLAPSPDRLRPTLANPILANPCLAKPHLCCCVLLLCVLLCDVLCVLFVVCVLVCVVCCVCCLLCVLFVVCVGVGVCCLLCSCWWCGCWFGPPWANPFRRDPLSAGPPRWTPLRRRTAQNFALFSLSCHNFHSFFSLSLCVFSLNFVGVFDGRDPKMCTFGLSAVV